MEYKGKTQGNTIILANPLPVPDGTEVAIIVPMKGRSRGKTGRGLKLLMLMWRVAPARSVGQCTHLSSLGISPGRRWRRRSVRQNERISNKEGSAMSTLSPIVRIHLGKPLPPEAFLDRVHDELHRAEKELNLGRLAGLLVAGKLTWDQLK